MKNKKYHTVGTVLEYHTVGTVPKYHTIGTVPKYHTIGTVLKYHTVGTVLKYHTVGTVPKYHTVGTVPKYHTVGTVPKCSKNRRKRSKIHTPNTQIKWKLTFLASYCKADLVFILFWDFVSILIMGQFLGIIRRGYVDD